MDSLIQMIQNAINVSYREAEPLQVFLREHINGVGDSGTQKCLQEYRHGQLFIPSSLP